MGPRSCRTKLLTLLPQGKPEFRLEAATTWNMLIRLDRLIRGDMWTPCGGRSGVVVPRLITFRGYTLQMPRMIRGLYIVLQDIRHLHCQVVMDWQRNRRRNFAEIIRWAGPKHTVKPRCITHNVQDCLTTHRNNCNPSYFFPTTSNHGDHARIRYFGR